MRKLLCAVIVLTAVLISLGATAGWAQQGAADVIIMFREGVSHADRDATVRRAGALLRFNYATIRAAAAHVPHAAAMRLLEQHPDVVAIIPDRPVQAHAEIVPAGVQRIGAAPGQSGYTGAGVGVAIADTGIGIAPGDLPHIFDRFWRADSARTRTGERPGAGLGLAICKWIAEAHGGTIEVQSRPGRGTTFTVTLPRDAQA